MKRALFLMIALFGLAAAAAAGPWRNRVVVSVDLTKRVVTIFNYKGQSNHPLTMVGPTLATVPGSVRPGTFRARLPSVTRRGERGASHLDHALLFDGMRSIRSSKHFAEMSAHPIAGSVILNGELGGILYKTIVDAGGTATVIIHQ